MALSTILSSFDFSKEGLPRSSQAMQTVLDKAAIPINYCSRDLRFLFVNQYHAELHGLTPEQIIGKTIPEVLGPEANEMIRPYYERALRGEQVRYEMGVQFKMGWRYIECIYNPVWDAEGKITGWVGVINDMTERQQLQKALQDNQEKLILEKEKAEAANIAKSEFLANMSHELRTPMNAVIGLTNILLSGNYPRERQEEYLQVMHTSAQHLLQLINDLLDMAKLEAGQTKVEHIPFDLGHLIEEVISINAVQAQEKGIVLQVIPPASAPDRIVGDPLRLRQVLMNLVGNAVKFTASGSVTVEWECHPAAQPGKMTYRIAVTDTGIGIAPEQLEHIFHKFTQADSSISRTHGGTGLGLSISKMLMELMQGTIAVESIVGKGSRFVIDLALPLQRSGQIKSAGNTAILPQQRVARQAHVLLVEDNEDNILVATALLEIYGYTYTLAKNGKEALHQLSHERFDAVLMDVQMPELDGLEVTRRHRAWEAVHQVKPVPIIGMTAHALAEDKERCLQAGMDAYLAKPFSPEVLAQLLQEVMLDSAR